MEKKNENALIVVNPMIAENRSTEVTLSKFIRVIAPCYSSIRVLGGNISLERDLAYIIIHSYQIKRNQRKLLNILNITFLQLKMAFYIVTKVKKKTPIFFWIGDKMIFPYLAAKVKKFPIYYFIYGNVAKESNNSIIKLSSKIIRFMAKYADYVCMESKSVLDEWDGLEVKSGKTIHLYTEYIKMVSVQNRKKIFGMVCRLAEGKHVIECIRAMSELHKKYPEWSLEIIGSGKLWNECNNLIKQLNAKEYIKLIGWVEHDKIFEFSQSWKYLLFLTDTEGVPNGLIEMMGYGIPALASAVGGIKDIIANRDNGFLTNTMEVSKIVKLMEEMIAISFTPLYKKMAWNAYNTVRQEFTLEAARKKAVTELLENKGILQ